MYVVFNRFECHDEFLMVFYYYHNSTDLKVSNRLNVYSLFILCFRVGVDEEVEMLPYSGGRSVSSYVFYRIINCHNLCAVG